MQRHRTSESISSRADTLIRTFMAGHSLQELRTCDLSRHGGKLGDLGVSGIKYYEWVCLVFVFTPVFMTERLVATASSYVK